MAFFPDKPADSDEIRFGAKQIRDNFNGIINDGIVISKPATYGSGIPKDSDGHNFERYIDLLTGNEYIKISGIWELRIGLDALYVANSELLAARKELANLVKKITFVETVYYYVCPMFQSNGIQNKGSYFSKDGTGLITITMRFNSSFGSNISMNSTPAIVMPVGARPLFDCYAPCYAENADWSTVAVKCGFMHLDTNGILSVKFPVVMFTGDDFVSGQISYYVGDKEEKK